MATPFTPILIWANTEGKDGYFHEKGDIKSGLVKGVMSCWAQDIENYDNEDYRDGAGVTTPIVLNHSLSANDYLTNIPDPATPVGATYSAAAGEVTATDESLHIPPRNQLHKNTLLTFWDDADGTGSVLYTVWAKNFISFEVSEQPPKNI